MQFTSLTDVFSFKGTGYCGIFFSHLVECQLCLVLTLWTDFLSSLLSFRCFSKSVKLAFHHLHTETFLQRVDRISEGLPPAIVSKNQLVLTFSS